FPRRHRQLVVDVAALRAKARMRHEAELDEQIARLAAADAGSALALQPDPLAVADAGRDLDPQPLRRLAAARHRDLHPILPVRLFQRDADARVLVGTLEGAGAAAVAVEGRAA